MNAVEICTTLLLPMCVSPRRPTFSLQYHSAGESGEKKNSMFSHGTLLYIDRFYMLPYTDAVVPTTEPKIPSTSMPIPCTLLNTTSIHLDGQLIPRIHCICENIEK